MKRAFNILASNPLEASALLMCLLAGAVASPFLVAMT